MAKEMNIVVDNITELYSKDKVLEELNGKLTNVQGEILKRKKEIGKENGLIVNSIDELVCKYHKNSKFKEGEEIPGSIKFDKDNKIKGGLKTYVCEKCEKDPKHHDIDETKAHDCYVCGIVYGEHSKKNYDDISIEHPLSGSAGENYHCKLCNSHLGSAISMQSLINEKK